MKKSAQLKEKITSLEQRHEEISAELAPKEDALEELRDKHGTAIADGAPVEDRQEMQAQIRALSEEVDGLRRAGPLLREAIASAREDLKKAEIGEAAKEEERLVTAALSLLERKVPEFRRILEEGIRVMEEVEEATRKAWAAERRASSTSGKKLRPASAVVQEGWWRVPGDLPGLLQSIRVYLAGGPQGYQMQQKQQKQQEQAQRKAAAS